MIEGDSMGTEKKTYIETGVSPVFQGTAYDDTLHDDENVSCCISVT